MGKYKITNEQRHELRRLYQSGDVETAKRRSKELGVSPYYGSILAGRWNSPKHARKRDTDPRWSKAVDKGPVIT